MRLFIAVDLDDAARAAIAAEQKRLAAAMSDRTRSPMKWVRPDHMHLTLVFLGEIEEMRVPAVIEAVGADVAQKSFEIAFAGVGLFPPRGAPNVLWIGVGAGARHVIDLQEELAGRAGRLGVALEARGFHPHLTLARWRVSRSADRARAHAAAREAPIARVRVDHATLYQSRLAPSGSTYAPLTRANLLT